MKARLALAFSAVLAGMFGSCQKPDTDAHTSGSPFSSSLTPPSVGPGDVPVFSASPVPDLDSALRLFDVANDLLVLYSTSSSSAGSSTSALLRPSVARAVSRQVVGQRFLSAPMTAASPPRTVSSIGGTGLSNYLPIYPTDGDQQSYNLYTFALDKMIGTVIVGSESSTSQNYQEQSDEYQQYLASSGAGRLFKRAFHRFFSNSDIQTFSYTDEASGVTLTGKVNDVLRSEWFKDVDTASATVTLYTGQASISRGEVISISAPVNGVPFGAKLVLKAYAVQPYSYARGNTPQDLVAIDAASLDYPVTTDFSVYDNDNTLMFQTTRTDSPYAFPLDESTPPP